MNADKRAFIVMKFLDYANYTKTSKTLYNLVSYLADMQIIDENIVDILYKVEGVNKVGQVDEN